MWQQKVARQDNASGNLRSGIQDGMQAFCGVRFSPFYLEMYMFKSKFANEAQAERVWLHVVILNHHNL